MVAVIVAKVDRVDRHDHVERRRRQVKGVDIAHDKVEPIRLGLRPLAGLPDGIGHIVEPRHVRARTVGQVLGDQPGAAAEIEYTLARSQLRSSNQRVELRHVGKAVLAEVAPEDTRSRIRCAQRWLPSPGKSYRKSPTS